MLLNPYLATTGVGTGGATYFLEERFEGTGYQNSWDETGSTGTMNEDYTTSPLEGSQSCLMSATAQQPKAVYTFGVDQTELWAFFRLRVDTALSATRQIFHFRNSSATIVGAINLILTTNTIQARNGSTVGTATTDAMTTGTDYNVWFHWKKGTGADGIASVAFSASGTEPVAGNAYSQTLIGNSTTDVHDLMIGFSTNSNGAIVIDKILVSTTGTIGDNPT